MSFESIPWVDLIGYVGGLVTLWGMHCKTMIPLRLGAVGGNVGFLIFGLLAPSYPTLVLHSLLLPLNLLRTMQTMRLIREIKEAGDHDNSLTPLLPYMNVVKVPAGTVLFRTGAAPDRMIVIKEGTIHLDEVDVDCGPGNVIGEIGIFTPDNRRTCTGVCATDCTLFTLGNETMLQLYYQNPQFGMYLVRTIVGRLLANWDGAENRVRAV